jgi:predicted neuraminidase
MKSTVSNTLRWLPLLIAALALILIWQRYSGPADWRLQINLHRSAASDTTPRFNSAFVSSATDLFVHSASVAALQDGRLLSTWFGGSREGAADVNIYAAFYDPNTGQWGDNFILASRDSTREAVGRTIRKLGNPVVSQAPDGKLWLFYVSVSLGGWAGSAINASYSTDAGATWSTPARLVTSPFTNISTLVKAGPIFYSDGSLGLPVYHEFLGKFAELLRLDPQGVVVDKVRISHGKHSLQPVIVAASENQATALMRYAGGHPKRMLASYSDNGGKSWPVPQKTAQANPNSALTALRLDDGSLLGVMNNSNEGRYRLDLMRSVDEGQTWQLLKDLEGHAQFSGHKVPLAEYKPLLQDDFSRSAGAKMASSWQVFGAKLDDRVCEDDLCRFIYDYPFMLRADDGMFQLVYTWNKSFIKHLSFNQAWLDTLP